jgi:hypothetical protein
MHEDLNLKYRDIKPTLPFYYNLGRRVTAGLGTCSLQVAASHSKSYVFGRSYGRTRWDGRRELQCEEPGAGVYDQLSVGHQNSQSNVVGKVVDGRERIKIVCIGRQIYESKLINKQHTQQKQFSTDHHPPYQFPTQNTICPMILQHHVDKL